jgi:pilus assembly protein CpaE
MILYFEPKIERATELVGALGSDVHLAASLTDLSERLAADRSVQLVLLGSGVSLADALNLATQMRVGRQAIGVVLLREQLDVVTLGEALRAGVREVVASADIDGIRAALVRSLEVSRQLGAMNAASAPPAPTASGPAAGKLVTVFAGKGGCGKSTMATNLATALSGGGARRVLLVDLDLSFGDVAIMLQLVPERSMVDAVPMAGRLDETGLRSLLTPFAPGVDALLAPAGPADGERVNRELVAEMLKVARKSFDFIVVDTPPFFSDQVLAALDVSDFYILLATPDIPSLKNLRLTLDMFDLLEYPKDERIVVLNRADARVGLTPSDIERVVRVPIQGNVPSTRDVPVSINRGVPLMVEDPNHPVSRAIRDLAVTRLGGGETNGAAPAELNGKRRPFLLRRGK